MVVLAMADDAFTLDALSQLNHIETEICTYIERQFLRTLEGGCTAPIGAIATYNDEADTFNFTGVLLSIDGKQKLEIHKTVDVSQWKKLGYELAQDILVDGGTALMAEIKKSLQK
jgi:hydroxymethylbilane synthase